MTPRTMATMALAASVALAASLACAQEPDGGGSSAPCAVPLAWRVGDIDPRFRLAPDELRVAVEAAGGLWEQATGARLFVHDPVAGFPVNLVYDDRQAEVTDRQQAEADLQAARMRLGTRRTEVERLTEEHRAEREAYGVRVTGHSGRVAVYDRRVRAWNEAGGAPADTVRSLQAEAAALRSEAATLNRWHLRLEESTRRLVEEQRRLNQEIAAQNRWSEQLGEAFPARYVQAGAYRERVRSEQGRVVSVVRTIDIFKFEDPENLVRLIAHELGHALGLGHVDAPDALMSERGGSESPTITPLIGTHDVLLFRDRCPDL